MPSQPRRRKRSRSSSKTCEKSLRLQAAGGGIFFSYLVGAYTYFSSETQFDVADASSFPLKEMAIRIDNESMLVTKVDGNTLTVERGILGAVENHEAGAPVVPYAQLGIQKGLVVLGSIESFSSTPSSVLLRVQASLGGDVASATLELDYMALSQVPSRNPSTSPR